jgi:hypothetical protein
MLAFLLTTLLLLTPAQEPSCTYSADCHATECLVATSGGGQACVPKQFAVAVWDHTCLEKVDLGLKSTMEAPLNSDGTPDLAHARVLNLPVTYKANCFHIEVRTRHVE